MVLGSKFKSGESLKETKMLSQENWRLGRQGPVCTRADLIQSILSSPVEGGQHLFCLFIEGRKGAKNRGDKKKKKMSS